MASGNGVRMCCFLLAVFATAASQSQDYDILLEGNGLSVRIGNASDLFVDVLCRIPGGSSPWQWHIFPVFNPSIPFRLDPTETSYDEDTGLLRVYSSFIQEHATGGTLELQCLGRQGTSSTHVSAVITFVLTGSLFFSQSLPSTVSPQDNLTALCLASLPTLPPLTVSTQSVDVPGGTSYMYCEADSARGSFRSRSVAVESSDNSQPFVFVIQPANITVQQTNGQRRGAFSCGISPGNTVQSITWYFDPADPGSGQSGMLEPMPLDPSNINVMVETVAGTSILVLDGVGLEQEGGYHCEVALGRGAGVMVSDTGSLTFSNTPFPDDRIILPPPPSLSYSEEDTVIIPCVGTTDPVFQGPTEGGTPSSFGLTFSSVQRENDGTITCQVGIDDPVVELSIEAPPRFETPLVSEITRTVGDTGSIRLLCEVSSNPRPVISFLKDGQLISPGSDFLVFPGAATCSLCVRRELFFLGDPARGQEGVYQCVAQAGDDGSTTITSSSYVNIQFLNTSTITTSIPGNTLLLLQPSTPSELVLTCSVEAHPIPSFTWTREGGTVAGEQNITRFRETASSVLTVPVEGLEGRVRFTCRAEVAGRTEEVTEVIEAYSPVTITEQPVSPDAFLIGENATLSCAASSIPIPGITWFRHQNGRIFQVQNNGNDVIIQSVMLNDTTVRSTLQLQLNDVADFSGYFCRGNNGFATRNSNIVQIEQAFAPTITLPPQDIIAVSGDQVTFTCRSRGNPLPALTWSLDTDSIRNRQTGVNEVESSLSLTALVNGTSVNCRAQNRAGTVTSDNATLIIADIPTRPTVTVVNVTARSVMVQWTSSFSALPLTQYSITLQRRDSPSDSRTTNVSAAVTSAEFTDLRPFSLFTVEVAAESMAGRNTGSTTATTLEDAPEAPPTNIVAEAENVDSIRLAWDPPPTDLQNGQIRSYQVRYQSLLDPADQGTEEATAQGSIRIEFTISGRLRTNTNYSITVAAVTVAVGPFSVGVIQRTYPEPPTLSAATPGTSGRSTQTVIPITLPSIDTSEFSHFWVIAMLLSDSGSQAFLSMNPSETFPNNDTFVSYSESFQPNSPYVVSEMPASSYQSGGVFFLGDENRTRGGNDFPERYRNGPLVAGRSYTVFVWAFTPSIPSQSPSEPPPDDPAAKRQATSPRQYSVFSSSDFLPRTSTQPVSTSVDDGLDGGEVAGVVIAVLLLLALLPMVVVMALLLARMWFRKVKDLGPPPTRQGSKRFQEERSVVTIVSNPRADSELQDLNPDDVRLPVPVEEFAEHVRKMHANTDHLFSEEYQIITIKSPGLPHIQGSLTSNVMKNRYANINCFDDTRVKLSFHPGVEGSDYINANYIDGYQQKQAYVATQGPLPNTVHDFWRMVWEEESCCVIMLTNLVEKSRVKCHQYWPETGNLGFGDITVTVIDTQELAYYTIRTFRISKGNDRREVKQFHYTGWPDFGVPDHPHPIIAFIRRINNFKRTTSGPDIIHCSAGVGRSGTLICIQSMMEMMEEEGTVDIFNTILAMRRQRNYMVQTERQYIFIHDAVLELIRIGNTEVSIQSLRKTFKHLQEHNPQSETSGMEEEYLKLCELPPVDNSFFSYATSSVNMMKNRHPNILPLDSYRVRLLMVPGVNGSDYINASYVDGYQRRHQYILTQGPMKTTVDEFWRMIWEHRVSAIMMLCQVEERGKEMCVRYWPTDKLKQHRDLFIELVQETDYPNYTCREFSLTNTKINESRLVKHYHYTDWTEENCPVNSSAIIDLIGVLQKTQHQNGGGPIVLHDSTPIGRAGTFCVLSSVLEQLKVEGVVDLFFFIHALRQQQPGLICTFEQYKFCYKSILEFLDSFDHYSNFD